MNDKVLESNNDKQVFSNIFKKNEYIFDACVHYCSVCNIPIIKPNNIDYINCPLCGNKTEYLSTDVRPVYPKERLLLELIKGKPLEFLKSSVWCANSLYFIDGKKFNLSVKELQTANTDSIIKKLDEFSKQNEDNRFEHYASKFCEANKVRLHEITDEAFSFVQNIAKQTDEEHLVISFSGGKDSTVTADIVTKALSNPSLVHIFGDTTLEFPSTKIYADRFRKNHPYAIFMTAKNEEQNFLSVADDIGPPARMMRWCCSMFKTGPITRVLNNIFQDDHIITFYGIRKVESTARSKYNRVQNGGEDIKIQKQTVASPIFFWKDIDIWLYLISNHVDFNDAYKLGYDRVGCWCCPNNNERAQFLSKIYMPEQYKEWRNFLIDFATKIGKPDPIEYIDSGNWKKRQGGNGLSSSEDIKIKFTNCTTEDNAKIYTLKKPVDDELINMFIPFGRVAPELGQKLLHETLVLDIKTNVPILSIQPFNKDSFTYAVKIKTMNVSDHEDLQRRVSYQIRKYNSCRQCLKCESLCSAGAITIINGKYSIDEKKCVHCKKCISQSYLTGGCMMNKYLKTKADSNEI